MSKPVKAKGAHGAVFLFFGVFLPAAALCLEANFHICARHFFDPFPSNYHLMLFALIPIANYLAWMCQRRDISDHLAFMSLSCGMAMGISILYILMMLPFTPLMMLWTFAGGIGLLGLSPLLAAFCLHKSGHTVCKLADETNTYFDAKQLKHLGHAIIIVTVLAMELPSTFTRINMHRALDPTTSTEGLNLLRAFGSQEVMLRACYERSGRATDILGTVYECQHPISTQQARDLFYKVTGRPFNAVPVPKSARATIQHAGMMSLNEFNAGVDDEFDVDPDIAGEVVSGMSRGLSTAQSDLTGKVYPNSGITDLTWAITFANSSDFDREARGKILLPHGAVVTGATMLVNGKKYETQIMESVAARTAYIQAAQERKNPLMISYCGPDRVMFQCYPIRPHNKACVELTMAVPMELSDFAHASFTPPSFDERNFLNDAPCTLSFTADSGKLSLEGGQVKTSTDKSFTAQADSEALSRFGVFVRAERNPTIRETYCTDKWAPSHVEVVSPLESNVRAYPPFANRKLAVVVDGSGLMKAYMDQIREGLKYINRPATICLINDSPIPLQGAENLKAENCAGGQIDAPIVASYLEKGQDVLWIHGAQPASSSYVEAIKTHLSQDFDNVAYDFPVVTGANLATDQLRMAPALRTVRRTGSVTADLKRLGTEWTSGGPAFTMKSGPRTEENAVEAPSSLAQLDAYNRVMMGLLTGDEQSTAAIAARYHIVTPVTSAILISPELATPSPVPVTDTWEGPLTVAAKKAASALSSQLANSFSAITAQLNRLNSSEERAMCMRAAAPVAYEASEQESYLGKANDELSASNKKFERSLSENGLQVSPSMIAQAKPADAPTVPESDTWLLIAAAGALLAAVVIRQRKWLPGKA